MFFVLLITPALAAFNNHYPEEFQAVAQALYDIYEMDDIYAPKALRLAWHSAGTYKAETGQWGSEGGHIRFDSVLGTDSNAGLDIIHEAILPLMDRFEGLTYADLCMLSGNVALDWTQGPEVEFCGGRSDWDEASAPPDGLLPPADHPDDDHATFSLENIANTTYDTFFKRMGFTRRELVALMASHSIGRMWEQNSGYIGTWDLTPNVFDNHMFAALATATDWSCFALPNEGMSQFALSDIDGENCTVDLPHSDFNMNPFDLSLKTDPYYRNITEEYAMDQNLMLKEFGEAWYKMTMLGVTCNHNLKIVDLSIIPFYHPLDIFNLGYEGVAQLCFILFVAVLCMLAFAVCLCASGLDARIKLAVHPTGSSVLKASAGGDYRPL